MGLLGSFSSAALVAIVSATVCHVAHATPVTASMTLNAQLTIGTASASDPQSTALGTFLVPLSVTSTATLPGGTVEGAGSASWGAGGNSGVVSFVGYGWDVSAPDATGGSANLNGASDWLYTFVADFNGHFNVSYNVTALGNTFGLQGWDILWSGAAGNLSLTDAFDPTASGVFSDAIVAGDAYTIELRNNANIFTAGAPIFGPGSMDGLFEFSMTADPSVIPEPETLTLLGFALAGLGVTRRWKS